MSGLAPTEEKLTPAGIYALHNELQKEYFTPQDANNPKSTKKDLLKQSGKFQKLQALATKPDNLAAKLAAVSLSIEDAFAESKDSTIWQLKEIEKKTLLTYLLECIRSADLTERYMAFYFLGIFRIKTYYAGEHCLALSDLLHSLSLAKKNALSSPLRDSNGEIFADPEKILTLLQDDACLTKTTEEHKYLLVLVALYDCYEKVPDNWQQTLNGLQELLSEQERSFFELLCQLHGWEKEQTTITAETFVTELRALVTKSYNAFTLPFCFHSISAYSCTEKIGTQRIAVLRLLTPLELKPDLNNHVLDDPYAPKVPPSEVTHAYIRSSQALLTSSSPELHMEGIFLLQRIAFRHDPHQWGIGLENHGAILTMLQLLSVYCDRDGFAKNHWLGSLSEMARNLLGTQGNLMIEVIKQDAFQTLRALTAYDFFALVTLQEEVVREKTKHSGIGNPASTIFKPVNFLTACKTAGFNTELAQAYYEQKNDEPAKAILSFKNALKTAPALAHVTHFKIAECYLSLITNVNAAETERGFMSAIPQLQRAEEEKTQEDFFAAITHLQQAYDIFKSTPFTPSKHIIAQQAINKLQQILALINEIKRQGTFTTLRLNAIKRKCTDVLAGCYLAETMPRFEQGITPYKARDAKEALALYKELIEGTDRDDRVEFARLTSEYHEAVYQMALTLKDFPEQLYNHLTTYLSVVSDRTNIHYSALQSMFADACTTLAKQADEKNKTLYEKEAALHRANASATQLPSSTESKDDTPRPVASSAPLPITGPALVKIISAGSSSSNTQPNLPPAATDIAVEPVKKLSTAPTPTLQ